jgi:O-antigen/teichoic acid export membrane protein
MTEARQSGAEVAATRDQDLRQLARHSGLNLAGSIVAACLNLVLPVLITRTLVQGEAGVFFQATALFSIVITIGTFGADTGLVRFLPRAIAQQNPRDVVGTLRVSIGPPLALALVLTVVLVALAGPIGDVVVGGEGDAGLTDTFTDVFVVLCCAVPIAVVYLLGLAASRGLGSMFPLVVIEKVGRSAVQTIVCAVALLIANSVLLLTLAWAAPYVAALAVLIIWTVAKTRRVVATLTEKRAAAQEPTAESTPHLAGDFWRFSAPRALSRAFTVALQRLDIVLVGALRGPADAALYTAATRFPILGLMFVQAIQQVMAPRISEFLALRQTDRASTMYQTTTAWLILVSWPIYLASVAFAPLLLDVFGAGYDEAAPAVVILCLVMLVATGCGPVDTVLLMGGRSGLSLFNTALALVVTVGLDLLLIPEFGITGAAVGWAAGILVKNLLPLWQVRRHLDMSPVGPATRHAVALSLLTGAVIGVCRLLGGDNIATLLVAGVAAAVTFSAGLWRWQGPLELSAMAAAARRKRRRATST